MSTMRTITEMNRQLRSNAVSYAQASIALEGFQLTDADRLHAESYINGEIELSEFVKPRGEFTNELRCLPIK